MRITHNADRYTFNTAIVHMEIYAESPYYKGVALWNNLPIDLQNQNIGFTFKNCLKDTYSAYRQFLWQMLSPAMLNNCI